MEYTFLLVEQGAVEEEGGNVEVEDPDQADSRNKMIMKVQLVCSYDCLFVYLPGCMPVH